MITYWYRSQFGRRRHGMWLCVWVVRGGLVKLTGMGMGMEKVMVSVLADVDNMGNVDGFAIIYGFVV